MCPVTPASSLTLDTDDRAPARSRAFVTSAHCPAHGARVLDEAQLLISELVTNAVRYGSPPITTEIECHGERGLRVRVSDGEPGGPLLRDADHDAENGRGMALVDLLSAEWGVEPGEAGKAVWFRLTSEVRGA